MGWIRGGGGGYTYGMSLSQTKRIAIDARWVFRELSGIGRYTLELLKQLGEAGGGSAIVVLVRDAERRAYIEQEAGLAGKPNFEFEELPHGVFSPAGQWAAARRLRGADRCLSFHEFHDSAAGVSPPAAACGEVHLQHPRSDSAGASGVHAAGAEDAVVSGVPGVDARDCPAGGCGGDGEQFGAGGHGAAAGHSGGADHGGAGRGGCALCAGRRQAVGAGG
jgi:hypothetical protein